MQKFELIMVERMGSVVKVGYYASRPGILGLVSESELARRERERLRGFTARHLPNFNDINWTKSIQRYLLNKVYKTLANSGGLSFTSKIRSFC